jgi:uncharacterized protein (DUF2141 family)
MRITKTITALTLVLVGVGFAHVVSGYITGVADKGDVYIAMYVNDDYEREPDYGLVLPPDGTVNGRLAFRFDNIATDKYVMLVFQDTDGDGDLNLGMFGPTEPWGNYRRSRPFPNFGNMLFVVEGDVTGIEVELD